MKLTVVIPIYNVQKYLGRCINSLLNTEGIGDVEIILVDDGSYDGSTEIENEYINRYSNIFLVKQDNAGPSAARNVGLEKASGDYVFFCDSDDMVVPALFSRVIDTLESTDADIVLWDAVLIDEDDSLLNSKYSNDYVHVGLSDNDGLISGRQLFDKTLSYNRNFPATVWLGAYKKKYLIENALFFENGLIHEDELWAFKVLFNAQSIRYIKDSVYQYRVRKGSLTNPLDNDRSLSADSLVQVYSELYSYFESQQPHDLLIKKVESVLTQRYLHMIFKYELYRYDCRNKIDKRLLWRTSGRIKDRVKVVLLWAKEIHFEVIGK